MCMHVQASLIIDYNGCGQLANELEHPCLAFWNRHC